VRHVQQRLGESGQLDRGERHRGARLQSRLASVSRCGQLAASGAVLDSKHKPPAQAHVGYRAQLQA